MFSLELRVVRNSVHEGLLGSEVGRRVLLGESWLDGVERLCVA